MNQLTRLWDSYAYSSRCTHVITEKGLSASKTHALIHQRSNKAVKLVTSEWAIASIKAGKRLNEMKYSPLVNEVYHITLNPLLIGR